MERSTQTPVEAFLGRTIAGTYRLEAILGQGAMGVVYRARDGAGAPAALKLMHAEAVADPTLRARFEREAKALFALRHPNILEVRGYGVEGGLPYLVMEYLEGKTLEDLVVEGSLDPEAGVRLGQDVLAGLAFAHDQGILHRDVKSENVFVTRGPSGAPRAVLLDFGLVKLDDAAQADSAKLTMAGSIMGSPAYMSPEQATGEVVDARSDVYAMGVVLYELVTGEWPFLAESPIELLRMHLLEPPPPLATRREGLVVRPELEALVQKALAKKRGERWASAREMLTALEAIPSPRAWLSTRPADASPALGAPPPEPSAPSGARARLPWLLGAGCALALLVAVAAALAGLAYVYLA